MNIAATITLADQRVELRCAAANLREDWPFTDADAASLMQWSERYGKASEEDLLQIGKELYAWINGADKFLERMIDCVAAPLIIEFAAGREESDRVRTFLDAPWELLADDARHWALREDLVFTPVRRIGKASPPPPPAPDRLGLVFMAAAPRNVSALAYEAEEASILQATKNIGLDLVVEESGTLDLLAACVAREQPEVVQISCHGTLEPSPGLVLEDDAGNPHIVKAAQLLSKLASSHVRLFFLSACETAEAHPVLDSLARSLVRAGAPAVLGWAGPVLDTEATLFASYLHRRLLAGEELAYALAWTRHELAHSEQLPDRGHAGARAHHWHLARLYFGPNGGGALATANGPRRFIDRGHAIKTFLDAKGKQVPVAGELEFVGRRRQIQTILREFRVSDSERHCGVLIHGMGRQGKSSLAARVAHRMEPTHDTVVLFGRYDAPAILAAFRDRVGTPEVAEIVSRHIEHVEKDPASLLPALTELLEGPCRQKPAHPVLLVIDDFEQALEPGQPSLRSQYVDSIRSVLLAFSAAATESRLLLTSRFRFTLPHQGTDLAERLLDLPLRGMDEREAHKQALAKLATGKTRQSKRFSALLERLERIIAASRGNAGLQDVLYSLCLEDPQACDRCLEQMEEYGRTGASPNEEEVRAFLENLALGGLLELLTPDQRELLRASTLFALPVPPSVIKAIGAETDLQRLVDLGLLEVYEDLQQPLEPALAINAMVRPLVSELNEEEEKRLAQSAGPVLFEAWGGEGATRRSVQDYELTQLGLIASNTRLLANCGAPALRFLESTFAYRQAAAWAAQVIAMIDAGDVAASVDLLTTAADRLMDVGEATTARALRMRAFAEIERGVAVTEFYRGKLALDHARALEREGKIEEALQYFETAEALASSRRSQAVVLGDIANIRAYKGEVDEALRLHTERLAIFEELGDKQQCAVALGDIAHIRAAQGEIDEALRLYHQELTVYEEFGDKRARAVTLGDIANIRAMKGEVDEALRSYHQELTVYEELGDKRSRALTLGFIARIRAEKGEIDEALRLLMEKLASVEELEDKRSRAITLGDIANIRTAKGEIDEALRLHTETLRIVEELGDLDTIANALWSIAQIELKQKKFEEAIEHLERSYEINLKIRRLDGICMVGLDLGQLLCVAGDMENGKKILIRSRDGFFTLGQTATAEHVQKLLDELQ